MIKEVKISNTISINMTASNISFHQFSDYDNETLRFKTEDVFEYTPEQFVQIHRVIDSLECNKNKSHSTTLVFDNASFCISGEFLECKLRDNNNKILYIHEDLEDFKNVLQYVQLYFLSISYKEV